MRQIPKYLRKIPYYIGKLFTSIFKQEILSGILLVVIFGIPIVIFSYIIGRRYQDGFLDNILAEAHGLIFDLIVFGILLVIVRKIGNKNQNIRRWKEEIDDFREWSGKEAMYRIVGNIRRLNRSGISKIDLSNCYLRNARLSGADLRGARLHQTDFHKAELTSVKFDRADFQKSNFYKANLKQICLAGQNVQQASFVKANLEDADLKNLTAGEFSKYGLGVIEAANFKDSNLCNANLEGSDLNDVDFHNADLRGANLKHTILHYANMNNADLGHFIYRGLPEWKAKFDGADLYEADLRGAKNLTAEQLKDVKSLYGAKLDSNLQHEIEKKYPHILSPPDWMQDEIEDNNKEHLDNGESNYNN